MTDKQMSAAQRAYEQKRAAKAGKSLDAWLSMKAKERQAAAAAEAAATAPPPPPKKPGLMSRLLDRAHKPLGK